jgi:hypothetical protein
MTRLVWHQQQPELASAAKARLDRTTPTHNSPGPLRTPAMPKEAWKCQR